MIMSKEKRQIEKQDLIPLDIYTKNRKQIRKDIVEFKKDRRIALGPYATFYFESFETMLAQVQEMLYIEKGGDVAVLFVFLILVTYVPWISTVLPNTFMGPEIITK